LIRPDGAIDINTGDGDVQQVVSQMESIAREQLPGVRFREPSGNGPAHGPNPVSAANAARGAAR
jgi:hypothetical protein